MIGGTVIGDMQEGSAPGIRIAVDAMGGDRGPEVVVQGVVKAARASDSHFFLVGSRDVLEPELAHARPKPANVDIIPASDFIRMDEQPTAAIRQKQNASVVVAARMVREKRADALVTIGNTGAAMAVSLLTLGRIKGIDRPAIALPLPSLKNPVVLIDTGATVDCDAHNLLEFAIMGCVYSEHVLGIREPRVGLLSNGEEAGKGNDLVKRTHRLFQERAGSGAFRFQGNVEGRDIFQGNVDVAVCDGFVGNVVLKTGEAVAEMVLKHIKADLMKQWWLLPFVAPLKPALKRLQRRIDPSEFGGAPLLGVNGMCIIGHGRSDAHAIYNACRVAETATEHHIIDVIRERVCKIPRSGDDALAAGTIGSPQ